MPDAQCSSGTEAAPDKGEFPAKEKEDELLDRALPGSEYSWYSPCGTCASGSRRGRRVVLSSDDAGGAAAGPGNWYDERPDDGEDSSDCDGRCTGVGRRRRFEPVSRRVEGSDERRSSWRSWKVDAMEGSWTRGLLLLSSLRESSWSGSGCGDHDWGSTETSGRDRFGTGDAEGEKSN